MGLSSFIAAGHFAAMKMRLESPMHYYLWQLFLHNSLGCLFLVCFFETRFLEVLSSAYKIQFLPLYSAAEVCTKFSFPLKC